MKKYERLEMIIDMFEENDVVVMSPIGPGIDDGETEEMPL